MLVLASASPRRQQLLRNAGIPFVAQPANIPEVAREREEPQSFAERMAREKALLVFRVRPDDFVLGADTIVVVDDLILGKPRGAAEARECRCRDPARSAGAKTHVGWRTG